MSNKVIKVKNISKRYRIGISENSPDTLSGYILSLMKSPFKSYRKLKSLTEFNDDQMGGINWALRDVSFDIDRGQVVGIIGKNGAGKSTLLKILCRITSPTSGEALLKGRIASLLEVGTGFHPELTGKENIFLNGTMLGMTKNEVREKFNEIVNFSEIEGYIDTPVKRYSSGMRVRLAFAVAAHLDPEILLIDEVLAVGDVGFQRKCLGKMGKIVKKGKTILFVTHNMSALTSLCSRTILLDNGKVIEDGDTNVVVKKYLSINSEEDENSSREKKYIDLISEDKSITLKMIRTMNDDHEPSSDFLSAEKIILEFKFILNHDLNDFIFGFDIKDEYGSIVFRSFHNDLAKDENLDIHKKGSYTLQTIIPGMLLNGGIYTIEPCATIFKKYWIFKDLPGLKINIMFDVPNPSHTYKNSGRPGYFSPILKWKRV